MKNTYRKLMEQQSLSEKAVHNFYTALQQNNSSNKYRFKLLTTIAYILFVVITFVIISLSSTIITGMLS